MINYHALAAQSTAGAWFSMKKKPLPQK